MGVEMLVMSNTVDCKFMFLLFFLLFEAVGVGNEVFARKEEQEEKEKLPSWNTTNRRHFKMAAVACLGGFADRIISKFINFSEYYVLFNAFPH